MNRYQNEVPQALRFVESLWHALWALVTGVVAGALSA